MLAAIFSSFFDAISRIWRVGKKKPEPRLAGSGFSKSIFTVITITKELFHYLGAFFTLMASAKAAW